MRTGLRKFGVLLGTLLLGSGLVVTTVLAADKATAFTGEIGDVMCGAKHEMEGSAATCTRECIQHGSKYALISGDKVYTLESSDKAVLTELDKLAGQKAKVMGTASGTTIQVGSVTANK